MKLRVWSPPKWRQEPSSGLFVVGVVCPIAPPVLVIVLSKPAPPATAACCLCCAPASCVAAAGVPGLGGGGGGGVGAGAFGEENPMSYPAKASKSTRCLPLLADILPYGSYSD